MSWLDSGIQLSVWLRVSGGGGRDLFWVRGYRLSLVLLGDGVFTKTGNSAGSLGASSPGIKMQLRIRLEPVPQ